MSEGEKAFLAEAERSANATPAAEANRLYDQLTPGSEGATIYERALAGGVTPRGALFMATDPLIRDRFARVMAFTDADFAPPAVAPVVGATTQAIETMDGKVQVTMGGKMPTAGTVLSLIGDVRGRIDELRETYHVDDLMLGIQVVLGPTAALKAIAKGVVGDKVLGDGINWLSDQASSRVTAWATGVDLQQVQYLLGADEKVLAGIKPEDQPALAAAHAGYGKIDVGSKTALTTLLGVLLGVRKPGGTAVIGRMDDLKAPGALRPGEYTIADKLPDLGSPKANYYNNMSVLRQEMRRGVPIRDASAAKPDNFPVPTPLNPGRTVRQTFTGAERNQLRNRGWTFDGTYWNPPK